MTNGRDNFKTADHLGYLDGLRALSAIFVVLHHSLYQVDFTNGSFASFPGNLLRVFYFGHHAVDVFIVLSGFCLMLPVVKGNGTIRGGAIDFFMRRARRILPTYYIALVFSLLLIWTVVGKPTGTHWDTSLPVTGRNILTHLLLVQDAFNDYKINHVMWSISVEWRIYFLFPLLVWSRGRMGGLTTAALAVILSLPLYFVCDKILHATLSAHYIGLFAEGMLGADIAFSPGKTSKALRRLPWGWLTIGTFLLVLVLSPVETGHGSPKLVPVLDCVVGAWTMALLVLTSCNESHWTRKVLNYSPVVFIGTFAYSLYLIHAPLIQVLWQYVFFPLHTNPVLMFAALALLGTPVIIGISYLFSVAFERPFIGKSPRKSRETLVIETALEPGP